MVNATVDNIPVKHILTRGDSVTVPSGEVWDITVHFIDSGSGDTIIKINGNAVLSLNSADEESYNYEFDTVLVESDTIALADSDFQGQAIISGFVVNENYTP